MGAALIDLAGTVLQVTSGTDGIVDSVFIFLVSFLVGTAAIHVGAQLLIDRDTGYGRAMLTALLGALVYSLVGFFLGWIPLLGPILMLLAWVFVVNVQYPGGWGSAAGIGLTAWAISLLLLFVLAKVGVVTSGAFGVPGA